MRECFTPNKRASLHSHEASLMMLSADGSSQGKRDERKALNFQFDEPD